MLIDNILLPNYWIRPSLDIINYQLTNLFNTLKEELDLNSPPSLSQETQEKLYLVQNKLKKQFLTCIRLKLPLELLILPSLHSPTRLLAQRKHPIKWIYTHFKETKSLPLYLDLITLIIINKKTKTLIGSDPHQIILPINKAEFKNTLQTSTNFQIAFLDYFREFHFITLLINFGISSNILNLLSLALLHHNLYLKLMFSIRWD